MAMSLVVLSARIARALTLDGSTVKGTVTVDKLKPANGKLSLSGQFLPVAGPSPDVAGLPVTFTVGGFSQVLPAGAFKASGKGTKTTWSFKGRKGGLTALTIVRPATGAWTFSARASGIVLAGTANPIAVALRLGGDQGAVSRFFVVATDSPARRVFKLPAAKKDDADGDGATIGAGDCDDQDPTVFPGAPERCDGTDDDCDDDVDEGFDVGDACAAGVGACRHSGVTVCAADGGGTVCDASTGLPASERCGNDVDDDCDGQTDEGFDVGTPCTIGTGSCARSGVHVCAPDGTGTVCDATPDPTCTPGPVIAIVEPANLSSFTRLIVTVSGTVSADAVEARCNEFPATVGGGVFRVNVTLEEGTNVIACVAKDAAGQTRTASLSVTVDTQPPRVTITAPDEGSTVSSPSLTVTGLINDVVVGTVNQQEARVDCNGVRAQIANRTFIAPDVALVPGPNIITCVGTDQAGNADSARVHVDLTVASGPLLRIVSGDGQSGAIATRLAEPLVVSVTDGTVPLPGKTVLFRVLRNDGTVQAGAIGERFVAVVTDGNGRAQVDYTLGTWAGAGNNQVQATAPGIAGEVLFSESATPGSAARIVVDAGNYQEGAANERLPLPFVAVAIDDGNNRLAGVPVTFQVTEGGGSLGGQPSLTVDTDSDGRAEAVLTLGPEEGPDGNVVVASFAGNAEPAAVYVASGKVPGNPAQTRVSGVVLDNTNQPIAGVTLGIEDPTSTTTPRALLSSVRSDLEGQFVLSPVPVGHVFLFVEGATAQRPGVWPRLEFELVTVAGRDNTVGMPIYLLPIDVGHGLLVDDTSGGTITLPDVPGFSLTVLPGSVTFLNGTHRGTVSVTSVHPDKVPMVPSFGQQPRFIVTIQPAGVHFNPPAAMTIPNADGLAPGQKTEMYSFDHDLGQFVSIGPGTVSDDGSIVASDPGVGVIKGGWHSAGNPPPAGDVTSCNDGNACTTDVIVEQQSQKSCRHTQLADGIACTIEPPVRSAAVRCGDDFIDVSIAESCDSAPPGELGLCLQSHCKAGPFSSVQVAESTTEALSAICSSAPAGSSDASGIGCIGRPLRDSMQACVKGKGIEVKCNPIPNGTRCAEAPTPPDPLGQCLDVNGSPACGNQFTFFPNSADLDDICGSLSSVALHEMVHAFACDQGGVGHPQGRAEPDDRPYGCQEACFPGSTGDRGNPEACK
jgi:hypothetical protein